MKYMLAVFLFLFSVATNAKEIKVKEIKTAFADGQIVQAGWRTSERFPVTTLSSADASSEKWFVVRNINGLDVPSLITVSVDNQDLVYPINSGALRLYMAR